MFRKPKSKVTDTGNRSIRRRLDEGNDSTNLPQTYDNDNEEELKQSSENLPIQNQVEIDKKHTGLSFDQQEGDDVVNFKLKKHTSHHKHASSKTAHKHQVLVERMERLKATTKEVKKEEAKDNEFEVVFDGQQKATHARHRQKQTTKFRIPAAENDKAHDNYANESLVSEEPSLVQEDAQIRKAFPNSFTDIPDAKAVYEARKKREMLRQIGTTAPGEYIPLDDTVKLKSNGQSGERARLIREDENDMSDEEETGSFYSAKKMLQNEEERRREAQANFLEIEQGGSDYEDEETGSTRNTTTTKNHQLDEDDELQRWEREQIRKGVSSNKVIQMQDELNATSMHFHGQKYTKYYENESGEIEMEIDMEIETYELQQQQPSRTTLTTQNKGDGFERLPIEINILSKSKTPASVNDILERLQQRFTHKLEQQNNRNAELERTRGQIFENTDLIHKLEHGIPELEQKFRLYQDMRLYTRDLLDCLNEKIVLINALDDKVMEMWKQRTERLIRRRRQDVQDQYERCSALATGRVFTAPTAEFAQRETEREARRNRRRMQRRTMTQQQQQTYYEGLSSDDEETQSQEYQYRDTLDLTLRNAQEVFIDTEEEFFQIKHIMSHLISWLALDEQTFKDAYIPLLIPKLLGPFIQLQMLTWRPLKESTHSILHTLPWYQQLLTTGLNNSGLASFEHPVLVQLIPAVVEKILFPKIARIVREQWDPFSLSESTNLSTLLRTLVNEYPVASAQSKRMQEILQQIHAKIKDSIEHDTFVPLYSKEAMEIVETGCGAFMDRQFWRSIKFMRSILCFRSLLSDVCLEELLIEGLVNRCTVMSLQFSVLSSPITAVKCRALIEEIPVEWFPSTHPSSYRPLAMVLKQVIELHQHKDRKFVAQVQKFVDMALTTVKQEQADAQNEE